MAVNPSDPGTYSFWGNDPTGYSALEMRRRIAMQMMQGGGKKGYPKNLGEGLASIGDSLGEGFMMKALERQTEAQRKQDEATEARIRSGAVPGPVASAVDPAATPVADAGPLPAPMTVAEAPPVREPVDEIPGVVRTNPDGSIAGNITSPSIPTTVPVPMPRPRPEVAAAPPVTRDTIAAAAMTPNARVADSFAGLNTAPAAPPVPPVAQAPPMSAGDAAGAATLASVTGMPGGPTGAYSYPQTASRGDPGTLSDAPNINGISPKTGAAITDTSQQVRDAIATTINQQQNPVPVVPPVNPTSPPDQRVAQAGVFPPVATDQPRAIIPGGGLPPTIPPAPAAQPIQKAPEIYEMEKPVAPTPPKQPGMGPREAEMQKYLTGDYSPRIKAVAGQVIAQEQAKTAAQHEYETKIYEAKKAVHIDKEKAYDDYQRRKNFERAQARGESAKATQEELKTGGYVEQLKAEQSKRVSDAQEADAKATTAKEDTAFQTRTGLPRSVFIPEFLKAKESANKAATGVKSLQTAKEALDSGLVVSGFGANARFHGARIAAKIGSNDEAKIAYESERYKQAMDSTINTAVQMVQGSDPKVTNADIDMAKGLTGTPEMQEASKRKIIEAALERQYGTLHKYEGDREYYLRGDRQHRYFKVDAPQVGTPDMRAVLLKNRDNEKAQAIFDRQYGPGAAALEIARAKRREEREDD